MKGWTKLNTFNTSYQAELRQTILEENDVRAVVIIKKDSMFLWGEVELWVENNSVEKARALIDEFIGFSLVLSLGVLQPVKNLQKILEEAGIPTILMTRQQFAYLLDNYALYVKNDLAQEAFNKREQPDGWLHIASFDQALQAELRVQILQDAGIQSLITKKRDSEFHVEEIKLFVKEEKESEAELVLTELKGWQELASYPVLHRAQIRVALLAQNGIPALIVAWKDEDKQEEQLSYSLYAMSENVQQAEEIIKAQSNWLAVNVYPDIYNAQLAQGRLRDQNIEANIVNLKDSSFLLGEIRLYVDEADIDLAKEILKQDLEKQEDA